jgi:hypothetical protein
MNSKQPVHGWTAVHQSKPPGIASQKTTNQLTLTKVSPYSLQGILIRVQTIGQSWVLWWSWYCPRSAEQSVSSRWHNVTLASSHAFDRPKSAIFARLSSSMRILVYMCQLVGSYWSMTFQDLPHEGLREQDVHRGYKRPICGWTTGMERTTCTDLWQLVIGRISLTHSDGFVEKHWCSRRPSRVIPNWWLSEYPDKDEEKIRQTMDTWPPKKMTPYNGRIWGWCSLLQISTSCTIFCDATSVIIPADILKAYPLGIRWTVECTMTFEGNLMEIHWDVLWVCGKHHTFSRSSHIPLNKGVER